MTRLPKYKYFFAASDVAVTMATVLITLLISNTLPSVRLIADNSNSGTLLIVTSTIAALLLFVFFINNLYKINIIITRSAHLTALLKSVWYFILIAALSSVFVVDIKIKEAFILILTFALSSIVTFYIVRVELLRRIYLALKNKQFKRNILIVGNGQPGRMLAAKIKFENPLGINIVGFLDDEKEPGEEVIKGKKILGKYSEIKEIAAREKVDEILIVKDTNDYEELLRLIDLSQSTNIRVKITSDLFKIIPQKTYTEKYYNLPVINMSPNYTGKLFLKTKRLFDVITVSLSVFLLAPVFLIIALLVKLTSEGPVIIKQKRIGKGGVPFTFYKFRSMYIAKEEDYQRKEEMLKFMKGEANNGGSKKVINKKRITPVGRILRKMSLDELPQLFNVIKGEMSLVGPRPCLPYEYENYDNWQKRRFTVIPGCTGVWQVMGRSSVSFNDSIVLDLYYINNMSPWLDLQLVIKTIPVMVFERGGE